MRNRSAASSRTTPPPAARIPAGPYQLGRGPHYPSSHECFGCAPAHPSGLRIQADGDGGFTFTIQAGQQSVPGRAHGGLLAAAVDEVMGILAWSLGGSYATARLEVDYLIPVPTGTTIHIGTRCAGVDGRKVYMEAEARLDDPAGPVAVRAAALYVELAQ